jgi:hypothetical protein
LRSQSGDALRQIAEHVADCFSDRGYAFIEDDKIDDLADLLGAFLTAADIPVDTPVAATAPDGGQYAGWSTHISLGWPLYHRETVLP